MSTAASSRLKEAFRKQAAALDWIDREHRRDDARKSVDQRFTETLELCEFGASLRPKRLTRGDKEKEKKPTRWQAVAEAWRRQPV